MLTDVISVQEQIPLDIWLKKNRIESLVDFNKIKCWMCRLETFRSVSKKKAAKSNIDENVITKLKGNLQEAQGKLGGLLQLYEGRLSWLKSCSRALIGPITDSRVAVVLNFHQINQTTFEHLTKILLMLIRDQCHVISTLLVMSWDNNGKIVAKSFNFGDKNDISLAVSWFQTMLMPSEKIPESFLAVSHTLAQKHNVDSILILTPSTADTHTVESIQSQNKLLQKLKLEYSLGIVSLQIRRYFYEPFKDCNYKTFQSDLSPRINCVCFGNFDVDSMQMFRSFSRITNGRFKHPSLGETQDFFQVSNDGIIRCLLCDSQNITVSCPIYSSNSHRNESNDMKDIRILKRWTNQLKNCLSEVDRILAEVWLLPETKRCPDIKCWLSMHNIEEKKLTFHHFFKSVSFAHKHEEKGCNEAQYCRSFLHLSFNDKTYHINILPDQFKQFESQLQSVIESMEKKVSETEIFGLDILEPIEEFPACILIDPANREIADFLRSKISNAIQASSEMELQSFSHGFFINESPANLENIVESSTYFEAIKVAILGQWKSVVIYIQNAFDVCPYEQQNLFHSDFPEKSIKIIAVNGKDADTISVLTNISCVLNGTFRDLQLSENRDASDPILFVSEDLKMLKSEMETAKSNLAEIRNLKDTFINHMISQKRQLKTVSKVSTRSPIERPKAQPQKIVQRQEIEAESDKISSELQKWLVQNSMEPLFKLTETALSRCLVTKRLSRVPVINSTIGSQIFEKGGGKLIESQDLSGTKIIINPSWVIEELKRLDKKLSDKIRLFQRKHDEIDKTEASEYSKVISDQLSKGQKLSERCEKLRLEISKMSPAAHVETEDAGEKVAKMEIRPTNYRRNPKFHLFKQHVVVRNDQDGFYYPGIILEGMANEFLTVRLSIGNIKSVPLGEIIFTGGANSCPVLKLKDYVLVRLIYRTTTEVFVPGVVQCVPSKQDGLRMYTVVLYNGHSVTTFRSWLIKISHYKYETSCCIISNLGSLLPGIGLDNQEPEYYEDFQQVEPSSVKRTAKSAPGKKPQLKLMSPKQRIEPKIRPRLGRLASDDRSTFFIDDWGEIF